MNSFLFIDGLPDDTTHEQLQSLFTPYGTVLTVVIARRPHSGFLPFAFVVMEDPGAADAARSALNGIRHGDHALRLDSALSPPFGWVASRPRPPAWSPTHPVNVADTPLTTGIGTPFI